MACNVASVEDGAGPVEAEDGVAGMAPGDRELPAVAPGSPLREVLATWGLAALAVFVARSLGAVLPFLAPYGGLLVGAALVSLALRRAARERDGLGRYGIALGGLLGHASDDGPAGPFGLFELARTLWRSRRAALRELAVAAGVALVVFPPYVLAFEAVVPTSSPEPFHLGAFVSAALGQLIVIALPEEVFFRGYVQTRLADALGPPRSALGRWLRIDLRTLALQALLFAAIHLATPSPNPARLATFFPGILFGALRARRGGVGAGIAFHALCNLLAQALYAGWLR